MPLARAALEAIQQDSFADDLELPADALAWTPEEVRAFCESGGVQKPTAKLTSAPTKEFSAIKLFGDSHANTFISVEPAVPGADSPTIIAYPYTAGSAMGLHHCDSITGYREALIGDLRGTQPGEAVVLKFGQVDCDFVYYLKWVEDQSLAFEAFAAASVRKYFCFIDNALATLPVTREQLHIMSPFPTVVDDAALRESLCTLPFMSASFKRHFRAKLMTLKLPSLAESPCALPKAFVTASGCKPRRRREGCAIWTCTRRCWAGTACVTSPTPTRTTILGDVTCRHCSRRSGRLLEATMWSHACPCSDRRRLSWPLV
jgi:hypothetical protein